MKVYSSWKAKQYRAFCRAIGELEAELATCPVDSHGNRITQEFHVTAMKMLSECKAALEAIKAYDPGVFRPLADEIAIYNLATDCLKKINPSPSPWIKDITSEFVGKGIVITGGEKP